jgi:hypothetical protein
MWPFIFLAVIFFLLIPKNTEEDLQDEEDFIDEMLFLGDEDDEDMLMDDLIFLWDDDEDDG